MNLSISTDDQQDHIVPGYVIASCHAIRYRHSADELKIEPDAAILNASLSSILAEGFLNQIG